MVKQLYNEISKQFVSKDFFDENINLFYDS